MYMYDEYPASALAFLQGEQLLVPSFEKGGSEKTTVWAINLQACNFIKKRVQHRCFPVNLQNF